MSLPEGLGREAFGGFRHYTVVEDSGIARQDNLHDLLFWRIRGGQLSGAQGQSAVTEARANQAANLTFNVILSTAKPGR